MAISMPPRRAGQSSQAASSSEGVKGDDVEMAGVKPDGDGDGFVMITVLAEPTTVDASIVVDGFLDSDDDGVTEPRVMAPATKRSVQKVSVGVVAAVQPNLDVVSQAADVVAEMAAAPCRKIARFNALHYPPPSLHDFRNAASRVGTAPAEWFERFTGKTWDMTSRSYHIATSRWRLLLPGKAARARECDRRRDRSSRVRPVDDSAKRQQRRARALLVKAASAVTDASVCTV